MSNCSNNRKPTNSKIPTSSEAIFRNLDTNAKQLNASQRSLKTDKTPGKDSAPHQLKYRSAELAGQGRETRLLKMGHTCLGVSDGSTLTLTAVDHHDSLMWSRSGEQKTGKLHVWSPYGSGAASSLLPGFNGERADPVSGSYHLGNGYRAYNPVLMRFNCPDSLSPFGSGGINPYAYCAGDPVNHTDPSGHISWQGILGIVTGAIGLTLSVVTAGASIAAAGSVMAAVGAASTSTLVVGGLGVMADVTAIASGAAEDTNPQAASVLGWVSMATGIAGMAAGLKLTGLKTLKGGSHAQSENFALGGTMKNLDPMGRDIYLFDDTYKGGKRLNLVAHGALEENGSARIARSSGENQDASELFSIISKRKNLSEYDHIRTIMCFSGNGKEEAFGQKFATLSGLPVKSYRGTVTGNFEVNVLNKILYEAAATYGDAGLEFMKSNFSQKYIFEIRKTNPYPVFSTDHWQWNFDPVRFKP
ncbi:RHS repeat-associated core domain-containing protein [Kosakonia sp. H02]|nr:RHS repeat-associated core domain-containing protein [Kosakonia sp. H02]